MLQVCQRGGGEEALTLTAREGRVKNPDIRVDITAHAEPGSGFVEAVLECIQGKRR